MKGEGKTADISGQHSPKLREEQWTENPRKESCCSGLEAERYKSTCSKKPAKSIFNVEVYFLLINAQVWMENSEILLN